MIYIGVDPGASGAIACIHGDAVEFIKNSETEHDLADWLKSWPADQCFAHLERVSAMPKQGVSSTFKFGVSAGFLRGLLVCCGIPFEMVTPSKWMGFMGCRTGGDKNISKAKAQQLFPHVKVTHANADALLLAEHCRRTRV